MIEIEWTLTIRRYDDAGMEEGKPEIYGDVVTASRVNIAPLKEQAAKLISEQIRDTIIEKITF